jgi:hypothetical protein
MKTVKYQLKFSSIVLNYYCCIQSKHSVFNPHKAPLFTVLCLSSFVMTSATFRTLFVGHWIPFTISFLYILRLKGSLFTQLHFPPHLLFSGFHLFLYFIYLGFPYIYQTWPVSLCVVARTVRSCKWSLYVQRIRTKWICVLLNTCVSHSYTGFLVFPSLLVNDVLQ